MNTNHSCRIYLQHEFAQAFFDEALHPDLEALSRRDRFIAEEDENCPYWREGNDLVAEIPDIDWDALSCANVGYQEFKVTGFAMQPMSKNSQAMPYEDMAQWNLAA